MSEQGPITSFRSGQWKYDIFLSFRGEDTRKSFTDHLYTSLEHHGIRTFRDDQELQKGKAIRTELLTAIEESRFALIVLSSNYASSTWCLDELANIVNCMGARETVIPIFYDVNPSDVRRQTGTFAEAFTVHEQRFQNDIQKVQRWRYSLTTVANLSGWNSRDWYESKLIKNVVEVMWTKLRPNVVFSSTQNIVGIDARLKKVESLLDVGGNDVRFVGIWGIGGIGKTTLAEVVYKSLCHKFEGSSFLPSIKEAVERDGLLQIQEQLLSGLSLNGDGIHNVHEGTAMMRRSLRSKKVLLVLDDVSSMVQLEYLAGAQDWFGPGSRIIITTRDEQLLSRHGVQKTCKVEKLNDEEALELFSWHAFGKPSPEQDYHSCSSVVNYYAKGLPLALKVIGSSLRGRSLGEWNSAVGKMRKNGNSDILEMLKICFDNLNAEEREVFLDIACFLRGEKKDATVRILEALGYCGDIGLDVLVEKSLITISSGRIVMHDLLQEMGREIVHGKVDVPGKQSRLWSAEDVTHVLSQNTGTEAVEGIVLNSQHPIFVDHDAFQQMKNLRLLHLISAVDLPKGLNSLPNTLRSLKWTGYPLKSLPSGFNPEKLVELNMCGSNIETLWSGIKPAYNLETIDLSHCLNLIKTPDLRGIPYLQSVNLEGCTRLYEVDQSLGTLERLTLLNLKDCQHLVHFPSSVYGLKSLQALNISGCSKLDKLPGDLGYAESLKEIDASGTAIRALPYSIGRLKGLTKLNLKNCQNLGQLPSSVDGLKSLKVLNLSGCSKLEKLPNELGFVESLEELDVSETAIRDLPTDGLKSLKVLNLSGCSKLEKLPKELGFLESLEELDVSGTAIRKLPFVGVLRRCTSLYCFNCFRLVEKQGCRTLALTLLRRYLQIVPCGGKKFSFVIPGNEIPECFKHQSVGSSVSVELEPGWFTDELMGYAVCAVFAVNEHQTWLKSDICCQLDVDGKMLFEAPVFLDMPRCKVQAISDHLWLFYVPHRREHQVSEWQNFSNRLELSFVIDGGLEMKKCGVFMIYKAQKKTVSRKKVVVSRL